MIPFVTLVTPVDKPMVRIKFHHEEQVLWCHEVWWGILELWHASICLSWLCLEDIVWATQPFVTCYGGASSWASVIWKDYFAITVSEGSYHQNKTISIIFSTAEPFASTLSLMVDHYKSECLEKILDCRGSKFDLFFALRWYLMPVPCLKPQGCHLIPLF